jgi:proline iminopeptidase
MIPYNIKYISVDNLHTIYLEEYGNKNGIPILFIHGGPGAGCSLDSYKWFDLDIFRVILVDQRGCGRSKPLGEIRQNNIDLLVSDFELIRKYLSITKWHLFGGSWGSTLSLYYAIIYPTIILSLTLRGICLMRDIDINFWFYAPKYNFPDLWDILTLNVPTNKTNKLLEFYSSKLLTTSKYTSWNYNFIYYEMAMSNLTKSRRSTTTLDQMKNTDLIYSMSRIECLFFLKCRPKILENIKVLKDIPIYIVHGRYDMVCALEGAFTLKKTLPSIQLDIAETSGHSSNEPEIKDLLIKAVKRIASTNTPLYDYS